MSLAMSSLALDLCARSFVEHDGFFLDLHAFLILLFSLKSQQHRTTGVRNKVLNGV